MLALCVLVTCGPRTAPATVFEQRARLPPPASCADPIEGVWKAHSWLASQEIWYETELHIHRDQGEGAGLNGRIEVHFWPGPKDDSSPPSCDGISDRVRIHQDATGSWSGDTVAFSGTAWKLAKHECGSMTVGYNLDAFSGVVDPELQEFQSVNNDGGDAVNAPVVFRRIRCMGTMEPREAVAAPPYHPPTLGCLW